MGRWSRPERGGSGRAYSEVRYREEWPPGRENPGANSYLIVQVGGDKEGGNRTREGINRLVRGTPWATRKWRKAQMSGGDRQGGRCPGKRSLRTWARRGGSRCKELEKRCRQVKDGGQYGIVLGGGRDGMNYPEKMIEEIVRRRGRI